MNYAKIPWELFQKRNNLAKIFVLIVFFVFLGMPCLYAQPPIVSYWNFNEGKDSIAVDQSDNGNTGFINNPQWVAGFGGSALFYDEITDYVKVKNSPTFAFSDKITIVAWIKLKQLDPVSGVRQHIIRKERTFALGIGPGGSISFQICTDIGWFGAYDFSQKTVDTAWHQVAGVFDGMKMRTYIDGMEDQNFLTVNKPMNINSYDVYIGTFFESNYENFHGIIDELFIIHDALSAEQIQSLMPPLIKSVPRLISVQSPTKELRPRLSWFKLDTISSYIVQIDSTLSFMQPLVQINVADTSFVPLADLPRGLIYWRVAAQNPFTLFSATSSFVIIDPYAPVLIPCVPNPALDRRPVFKWFRPDSVTSGTYSITINTTRDFSAPYIVVSLSDTQFTPLADLPTGNIFWQVSIETVKGKKISCLDSIYIQVDSIPYLYRFNGATVTSVRPSFAWKPVKDASNYRIQIDTLPNCINPLITLIVSDTLFKPLADLNKKTYYWRVSSSKNFAFFSPVDSVSISSFVALTPKVHGDDKIKCAFSYSYLHGNMRIHIKDAASPVTLTLFTVSGKVLKKWASGRPGDHEYGLNGLPRGIYPVLFTAGGKELHSLLLLND